MYFTKGSLLAVLLLAQSGGGEVCLSNPEPLGAQLLLQVKERLRSELGALSGSNRQLSGSWECGSLPPWHDSHSSRVAVLLRGESFRTGHQLSRLIGVGVEEQLEATRSLMRLLIEPLERHGLTVDVFSATYTTESLPQLLSILGGHVKADMRTPLPGSQLSNLKQIVEGFRTYSESQSVAYKAVIVLRHDMVLKMDLGSSLAGRLDGEQFLVPFKVIKEVRYWEDRVPDTLQVMPAKFFGCFYELVEQPVRAGDWSAEYIWVDMEPKLGGHEHLGFVLPDVEADSDPEKIWNPLYKFAGRDEAVLALRASPTGSDPDEPSAGHFVVIGLLCVALVGSATTLVFPDVVERATGISLAYATCTMYAALSISIDLSIVHASRETSQGYAFSPAALVATVEFVKLVFSACMVGSRHLFSASLPDKSAWPTVPEGARLIVPAALYAVNNIIVFKALAGVHLTTFGVMRETALFWTAILWVCIFQVSIGWKRWLAMLGIFLGVTGNLIPELLRASLTWGCMWVAVQAFLTAAGAVSNEFTFKRMPAMDINLQNSILYCITGTFTMLYLLILEPAVVSSPSAFFEGFTAACWQVVLLQVVTGLLVSRILKYADSISKSVVAALRGPGVIFLGAIVFQQHLKASGVMSAAAVSLAAFMYLREGPLPK